MCLLCVESDEMIAYLFQALHFDDAAIRNLAELLADPTNMSCVGVPSFPQFCISLHFEGAFLHIAGSEDIGSAIIGTRPGHLFADLIFNYALGVILRKAGDALEKEQLVTHYPARSFEPSYRSAGVWRAHWVRR